MKKLLIFLIMVSLLTVGCSGKEKEEPSEKPSSIPAPSEEKEVKGEALSDGSQ